jgi:hypothetical protein
MSCTRLAAAGIRSLRLPAVLVAAALAFGASGAAQTLDLVPTGFHVTQSIQGGSTRLVGGKSTTVRVKVNGLGTIPAGVKYDGVLRVYVDGVELAGSPLYSDNGPLKPVPVADLALLDGTLNFSFVPPTASNLVFKVHVNPPGTTQIAETNYLNNVLSSPAQNFQCRTNPEIVFVPIDLKVPLLGLPDYDYVKPGIGDAFYQGIYPAPDANYHRSVAPSKVWAKSVSTSSGGVDLDVALAADMQLMVPVPDFIYGWVPGALPGYNGVAIGVPGVAAMGNTEPIRMQRTMAHEIGHLFGLSHNTATTNLTGIDVERQLHLTQGLPMLKSASLKDIMYAGLLTQDAWVREASYEFFFDNPSLACAPAPPPGGTPPARLLLAGTQDYDARTVAVQTALVFAGGKSTPFVALDRADLILHVFTGETLAAELGITTRSSADCPACGGTDSTDAAADDPTARTPIGGFATLLPAGLDPEQITRVAFVDPASGGALGSLERSEHAPTVSFGALTSGVDGQAIVTWSASDADGDPLRSYLLYSGDGERVVPLATALDATSAAIDVGSLPKVEPGTSYFEVRVSDGLRTASVRTTIGGGELAAFGGEGAGNAPFCALYSPDSGLSYPRGASVILHAHAWDVEEGRLDGANVVWTSSIDGPLGTGRLLTTADLSVGAHAIQVTVTDANGLSASDGSTIDVVDRQLPGLLCQQTLGFAGPGSATLAVCGGDLSTGTTADVSVSGASPSQPVWIAVGAAFHPTPLFGGTLVPFPPLVVVPGIADAGGDLLLADALPGGGGFTLYLQAAYLTPTPSVGITNAIQAKFLP